ncbi:unnamed protein product [Leptidea sinapis]|uniref:Uncharacterized protein n=1 Tax=Leptidea sinapis TaxID=189913 RepID=A0A5E4QQT3_9NEOP|nr:unnamed protein product [Leptidea sinapis]
MAITLGKYGVRVNNVSPGPVKTDIFARAGYTVSFDEMGLKTLLDRWGEPEEIADIVTFLASDKAKDLLIIGQLHKEEIDRAIQEQECAIMLQAAIVRLKLFLIEKLSLD